MRNRLGIRARITLGSILVALIVFAVALVAIRGLMADVLENADESLASGDLASFAADIRSNPDEGVDTPSAGVLVYVRDHEGVSMVDTLPHEIHEAIENRDPADQPFEAEADGVEYRIVGESVTTPAGDWTLWAARSSAAADIAVDGLDRVLAVGGTVLLIAFAVASWVLATAALRPVTRLRLDAERLAGSPRDATLPVGPVNDEIAGLARTLNAFLGAARASTEREKQVVSDAAHELRTPLAALKTQLELARAELDDPERLSDQLRVAEASVDRLSSLATNLLALSRLEAGADEGIRSTVDELESELMASIDRIRATPTGAATDLDFHIDESLDGSVHLSPVTFGRAVDNLLANSAAAGSGTVIARLLDGGADIVVEIEDDGPGMPAEFVPHAFERFSRPDLARTSGGSGLGLALVQAIAVSAGGTAGVENRDPGLRVTLRLPKM